MWLGGAQSDASNVGIMEEEMVVVENDFQASLHGESHVLSS